ncbi:hypothetical protein EOD43_13235 [Sphingomonas crocodyli]|uniref:Uncharacterized protein n=1 Tax=Sphingomonas crocodyli TaxID=1979270 RepID=A0A437MAR6_9SPHN|nr:hypothetical protein EOD43_13235 [Sphingomonas crocodyli]
MCAADPLPEGEGDRAEGVVERYWSAAGRGACGEYPSTGCAGPPPPPGEDRLFLVLPRQGEVALKATEGEDTANSWLTASSPSVSMR